MHTLLFVCRVALMLLISTCVGFQYVAAQAPTQGEETYGAVTLADLNVHDAVLVEQDGRTLTLSFNVVNGAAMQAGLRYRIELVRTEGGRMRTVDTKTYAEVFSVGEHTSVAKTVTYEVPTYLAGTFSAWVYVENESGMRLGLSPFDGVITLQGSGTYVDLNESACLLNVVRADGAIEPTAFTTRQGVDILPEESLRIVCTVQSTLPTTATLYPSMRIHERTSMGAVVREESADRNAPITVAQGEDQVISVPIYTATEPQAYDTALTLVDESGVPQSNTIFIHYIIVGKSATVQSASLDRDMYRVGDTAELRVFVAGPADSFAGLRRTVSTELRDPQLMAKISAGDGSVCASEQAQRLTSVGGSVTVNLPITQNCKDPVAHVALRDGAHVLDTKDFPFSTERTTWDLVYRYIPITVVLLVLITLVIHVIRSVRSHATSVVPPVALFALAFISSLSIVPASVQAASFSPTTADFSEPIVDGEYPFISLPSPMSPTQAFASGFKTSWSMPIYDEQGKVLRAAQDLVKVFTASLDKSTYVASTDAEPKTLSVSGTLSGSACNNVSDLYRLTASTNGTTRNVFNLTTIDVLGSEDTVVGVQDVANGAGSVSLPVPKTPGAYTVRLEGVVAFVMYGMSTFNSGDAGQYQWTLVRERVSYELPYTVVAAPTEPPYNPPQTNVCSGTLPQNAEPSSTSEETNVSAGSAWTYRDPATSASCEFRCKATHTYDAATRACTATPPPPPPSQQYSCQGSIPPGAWSWTQARDAPGSWDDLPETDGLTNNTTFWQYAPSDTSRSCEFTCQWEYEWQNGQCVRPETPSSSYMCQGTGPNNTTTFRASSMEDATGPSQSWHQVAQNTTARCEMVTCPAGQEWNGVTCVTPATGACFTRPEDSGKFINTVPWSGDNNDVTLDTPWHYSAVNTSAKCELHCQSSEYTWNETTHSCELPPTTCPPGQILVGSTCVPAIGPTVSMTFNGSANAAAVDPLAVRVWAWDSANAQAASARATITGCDRDPSHVETLDPWTPWTGAGRSTDAGPLKGSQTGSLDASWYGCVMEYTYTVRNLDLSQEATAEGTVSFAHKPAAPTAAMTFNGQTDLVNVDPLAERTWKWEAKNAVSATARVTITECDADPGRVEETDPWTPWSQAGVVAGATSLLGEQKGTPGAGRYGCKIAYRYTAANAAGEQATAQGTVQFTSQRAAAPSVDLRAVTSPIPSGSRPMLSWTTANVRDCVAFQGWSGSRPTQSAGETQDPITMQTAYKLECIAVADGIRLNDVVVVAVTDAESEPSLTVCPKTPSVRVGDRLQLTAWFSPDGDYVSCGNPGANGDEVTSEAVWSKEGDYLNFTDVRGEVVGARLTAGVRTPVTARWHGYAGVSNVLVTEPAGACNQSVTSQTYYDPPTGNLCTRGTASPVTVSGSWYVWTCSGTPCQAEKGEGSPQ